MRGRLSLNKKYGGAWSGDSHGHWRHKKGIYEKCEADFKQYTNTCNRDAMGISPDSQSCYDAGDPNTEPCKYSYTKKRPFTESEAIEFAAHCGRCAALRESYTQKCIPPGKGDSGHAHAVTRARHIESECVKNMKAEQAEQAKAKLAKLAKLAYNKRMSKKQTLNVTAANASKAAQLKSTQNTLKLRGNSAGAGAGAGAPPYSKKNNNTSAQTPKTKTNPKTKLKLNPNPKLKLNPKTTQKMNPKMKTKCSDKSCSSCDSRKKCAAATCTWSEEPNSKSKSKSVVGCINSTAPKKKKTQTKKQTKKPNSGR